MSKLPGWQPVEGLRQWDDHQNRGQHTVVDSNGVKHNLSRLPFEYWCDTEGNVVQLVIATTKNVKEATPGADNYSMQVHKRAMKRGWFRWNDGLGLKELVDASTWLKRREEIREQRAAKHAASTNAFNAGFRSEQEKLLEMLKAGQSANQEQMNAALERIADAMSGKSKRGKSAPDSE